MSRKLLLAVLLGLTALLCGTEVWAAAPVQGRHACPACGHKHGGELFMLAIGFLGQGVFSARFLVQWIASERAGRSMVPRAFWYLSIGGSLLLLAYAVSIRAWPIILGQVMGLVVYGRNLALIARAARPTPDPDGLASR